MVGYWRNGCSYRNIAREVGLHSNTVYGIIKKFRKHKNFICGRRTRRPRTTNDACCIALPGKTDEFSVHRLRRAWQPNVNFAVSRQTVNWRLVARACRDRQMVKVPILTVRAKLVRRHCASQFMLFRIDNRIRVRRLVGEAMNKDCSMVMWLTEAVLYMYWVVSLIWEKPPCAFWIRCHWSRLSLSSGGPLGSTWQDMVSQQLATG